MTTAASKNKFAESAARSLAMQPNNITKGFDVTKIDSIDPAIIEQLIAVNDLSALAPAQKVAFIKMLCQSLGLNPLSRPLQLVEFKDPENPNGPRKLNVYATKDCAEQLRKIHGVSVIDLKREIIEDICIVTAYLEDRYGKRDTSTGAVALMTAGKQAWNGQPAVEPKPLSATGKANAIMKAETKAKRRGTLSICGLGFLDESQLEDLEGATVQNLPEPTQEEIDEYNQQQQNKAAEEAAKLDAIQVPGNIVQLIRGAETKAVLDTLFEQYLNTFDSPETNVLFKGMLTQRKQEINMTKVREDMDAGAGATIKKPSGLFADKN